MVVYRALCAMAGLAGALLMVAVLQGLHPSWSLGGEPQLARGWAGVVDMGLVTLFGLQHSCMARSRFKDWMEARLSPEAVRSSYVLASGVMLILVLACWQPLEEPVWEIRAARMQQAVRALGWLGLGLTLWGAVSLEPLGLLGLGPDPRDASFKLSWLHQRVRHPMYTGLLVVLFATPRMSAGHLLFSVGMSLYLFVGMYYEELSLIRKHGVVYQRYRANVPMLIPQWTGWVDSSRRTL